MKMSEKKEKHSKKEPSNGFKFRPFHSYVLQFVVSNSTANSELEFIIF